jgi:hypothetical protein
VSTWSIAACSFLYLLAAVDFFRAKNYGLCLAFLAYAVANLGLIWAAKR